MSRTGLNLTFKEIAGVVAGNGLEFYDFLVYTFFAPQIGRTLFSTSGGYDLLLSLGTFGLGFLTRPIGAFVIGRLADRSGRRPAMLFALALMGIATVGLILTPPFSSVGTLASVLAILFRLLQGFALGGQVGPSTAYLLESAPSARRGLYISFQYVTQEVAIVAAGIVGLALSYFLTANQLDAWGWRLAFALGALVIPYGLAAQYRLTETLPAGPRCALADSTGETVRSQAMIVIAGILLIGAGTITHYTLDYLTVFAQTVLHMNAMSAFVSTIALGVSGIAANLAGGILSDRYGSKRVMLGPWLALIVLVGPIFMLLIEFHTVAALVCATVVLSLLLALSAAPALILVTEAVPPRVRGAALGVTYAVAISVFGGSTQFLENLLIRVTGSHVAPAWYMSAAMVIGLAGMVMIDERPRSTNITLSEEGSP